MPVVLDPAELASMRAELVASFPDTAHVFRGTGPLPGQTYVAPAPASATGAAIQGGISDGRGGFRPVGGTVPVPAVLPPEDKPDGTEPNAPPKGDNMQEIANYPCLSRKVTKFASEREVGPKETAIQDYMISLPFDADVVITDSIQISTGRAPGGGPTFDPEGVMYEVYDVQKERSNMTSLQVYVSSLI